MTTYVDFVPSNVAPPQFQATLDGSIYNVLVLWNLAGQRYYVQVADQSGNIILYLSMVGSPTGLALATVTCTQGTVTATCVVPHNYTVGRTIALTVSGVTPADYNGTFDALIVNATQFTYSIPTLPLAASIAGNVNYNISLTAGYFDSTLVWRVANNQFEIAP